MGEPRSRSRETLEHLRVSEPCSRNREILEHRASYYQSLMTEGCRQRTGSERLQSICAWVSRVALPSQSAGDNHPQSLDFGASRRPGVAQVVIV